MLAGGLCGIVELQVQGAPGGGEDARRVQDQHRVDEEDERHRDQHPDRHRDPHPALQLGDGLLRLLAGDQAVQHGLDAPEDVGHAGQVRHDVIPVQAQEGQELVDDLDVLERDHHEQRLVARPEVNGRCDQHEDRVEVHPAQVRAQAPAFAQAVSVGHVAVEGGPDHVDARPQHARFGPAVGAGCGVAALVEGRREDDQAQQQQHQHRLVEDLAGGLGDAVEGEDVGVQRHQAGQHGHHHRRPEERPEDDGDGAHDALRDQGGAEVERQHRVHALEARGAAVGVGQQAQRPQLLVDQVLRLLGAQLLAQ